MKKFGKIFIFLNYCICFMACSSYIMASEHKYKPNQFESVMINVLPGFGRAKSVKVKECTANSKEIPYGKILVSGCSLSVEPNEFDLVLAGIRTWKSIECFPANEILLSNLNLPKLTIEFVIEEQCSGSEKQLLDFNETIVYTNKLHNELLVFQLVKILQ